MRAPRRAQILVIIAVVVVAVLAAAYAYYRVTRRRRLAPEQFSWADVKDRVQRGVQRMQRGVQRVRSALGRPRAPEDLEPVVGVKIGRQQVYWKWPSRGVNFGGTYVFANSQPLDAKQFDPRKIDMNTLQTMLDRYGYVPSSKMDPASGKRLFVALEPEYEVGGRRYYSPSKIIIYVKDADKTELDEGYSGYDYTIRSGQGEIGKYFIPGTTSETMWSTLEVPSYVTRYRPATPAASVPAPTFSKETRATWYRALAKDRQTVEYVPKYKLWVDAKWDGLRSSVARFQVPVNKLAMRTSDIFDGWEMDLLPKDAHRRAHLDRNGKIVEVYTANTTPAAK